MSREYDIKNAAWDYFQDLDSHHFNLLPHCNPQTDAFEAGAKWADETMIDKACEWLDCFLERTIQRPSQIGLQTSDAIDIIEMRRHEIIRMLLMDFREAMKE